MLERTQLILDKPLKRHLHRLAKQKDISVSQLAREWLSEKVVEEKQKAKHARGRDARNLLRKMAASAVKGPGDSEYDKYAYDL